MSPRYPLATILPTVVGFAGILTAVVAVIIDRSQVEEQAVEEVRANAEFLIEVLAGEVEAAFRQGAPERSRASLLRVRADPELSHALLLDDEGRVTYSTETRLDGQMISATPFAEYADHLSEVRDSYETASYLSDDGSDLIVFQPLIFRGMEAAPARARVGLISILKDLRPTRALVRSQARRRAIVVALPMLTLSLLIAILFQYTFTRRMNRLLRQTQSATEGRIEEMHALEGNDEIAELSRALERMAGEIRQRIDTQTLMVAELDHRVKNTLATVLALANQTATSVETKEGFLDKYRGRIGAMARTHEALAASGWEAVRVREIVSLTVAPPLRETDVTLDGPAVDVSTSGAAALGLVLQELATNAVKHGSLGECDGHVKVQWNVEPEEDRRRALQITWLETNGCDSSDLETKPVSEGTGLTLIRGLVEYEIGGRVAFAMESTGFRCDIWLTLPEVAGAHHV